MLRLLWVTGLLGTPVFADAPKFVPVEITPHVYDGGWEHFVGGGVAVFDCDNDEMPEVFAAGGANSATLYRNDSSPGSEVSLVAQTPAGLALKSALGAYPIDINNDGMTDLVVLRAGANVILKGGPDCTFEPFDNLNIDLGGAWTTAFSATWEVGNELPTLAFGNYVDRGDPDGPFGACDTNLLLRPDDKEYQTPIKLDPSYCPLSLLFSDWGRNGRSDLRVSNDRHYYVTGGQEQLWAMNETPRLYSQSDGWAKHQLWGMGIASRDITGDGVPEVMMSSMGDQRLQSLELKKTGPAFKDAPFDLGTTAHRPFIGGDGRPSTGWHIAFGDVQNNGRDDIFIAKGNVEQMPGLAMKDPNNLLLQNTNGSFTEVGNIAGLASLHRGRGAALVDLNGDGLLDVVVVNRRAAMEVYQNTTLETGHWISVRLRQFEINRNAIGAWLEVDTGTHIFAREVTIGGGHAGGTLGFEHFGLGSVRTVRLRVIWPDRSESHWVTVTADRKYVFDRVGHNIVNRN
ncbi:MAG: CRTAC1 family protein [Amylibacter sp.]